VNALIREFTGGSWRKLTSRKRLHLELTYIGVDFLRANKWLVEIVFKRLRAQTIGQR
jgi:hypothetical protein